MVTAGNLLGDILACIGFFTRIPAAGPPQRSLAAAIWAAPLVGLLVGATGAAVFGIAAAVGLPASISALLAIGSTMLVTGCLHEDGLADVADGFGGGATRERKLEIMRDSRIGTFGVAALIVTVLLRWSALAALDGGWRVAAALLAAHAASRALVPAFMLLVPPARNNGLSAGAGQVNAATAVVAAVIGCVALLTLGMVPAIVAAAILVAWLMTLKALSLHQIGGQTGDVLGALQQGGEVVVLLVAVGIAGNI